MFVHSVYFWLHEGLPPQDVQAFVDSLESLKAIKSVKQCYTGDPAATERPVIDSSYSYGLVVVFNDEEGHNQYQVDPIHSAFRENCASYWSKVLIYDFTCD